jgi:hypothetical protein
MTLTSINGIRDCTGRSDSNVKSPTLKSGYSTKNLPYCFFSESVLLLWFDSVVGDLNWATVFKPRKRFPKLTHASRCLRQLEML